VSDQQGAPSEEELRAALEEQMRHIRVEDVLVQTLVTLINLGARRLGLAGPPEEAGEKDLEQARIAIEGARALQPLLPQEGLEQVRDALMQLQMAYAREARGGAPAEPGAGEAAQSAPPQEQASATPDDEEERAKARAKIWTPPGS
jgi:hypothetical protein